MTEVSEKPGRKRGRGGRETGRRKFAGAVPSGAESIGARNPSFFIDSLFGSFVWLAMEIQLHTFHPCRLPKKK